MMHALVIILPFRLVARRDRRARVLGVLAVRAVLFALLALASIKALLLYVLAYMLFLHVMRFMDVHQHTYEVWETLERPRGPQDDRFDRDYEHHNTYSNLISVRHPWLNLLVLNFGYHNAHHVRPTAPWYRLPRLHAELFVARVLNGDPPGMDVGDGRDFIGVVGVSFLTAH
jgi:fatty acid desaturase